MWAKRGSIGSRAPRRLSAFSKMKAFGKHKPIWGSPVFQGLERRVQSESSTFCTGCLRGRFVAGGRRLRRWRWRSASPKPMPAPPVKTTPPPSPPPPPPPSPPPPAPIPAPAPPPAPSPPPPPAAPPPPPPPTGTSSRRPRISGVDLCRRRPMRSAAYSAGATGKGVKIGVVDSGINPTLSDFAGRIDPASGDVYQPAWGQRRRRARHRGQRGRRSRARRHQHPRASPIEATIVNLRADEPGTCASRNGCAFYDDGIADRASTARSPAGARSSTCRSADRLPGRCCSRLDAARRQRGS